MTKFSKGFCVRRVVEGEEKSRIQRKKSTPSCLVL
jgi:hypothetical protein